MYNLIAIFIGFLFTIMVAINSGLTTSFGAQYDANGFSSHLGMGYTLFYFHLIALVLTTLTLIFTRKKFKFKSSLPFYFYIGGTIGFFMVFINTVCITKLGASLSIAAIILGQTLTSMIIDHYGLFKMDVKKFDIRKLSGLFAISVGLCLMIFGS